MTFPHPKTAIRKFIVTIRSQFVPGNDCELFVLVKLALVALFSGAVWVDGSSLIFIFGAIKGKKIIFLGFRNWEIVTENSLLLS